MDVYYDNFGEIINFLNSLISSETNYIYRGYNHNDEIYPAIIREKNYSSYEEELLNEFEKYGLAYFSPNVSAPLALPDTIIISSIILDNILSNFILSR